MSFALDFEQALNRDNPRALINLVSSRVAEHIAAIPKTLFEMSVEELRAKSTFRKDDENIELLRTAWWLEYNRCQKTQTKFVLANVYGGITHLSHFMKEYVGNSFNLLYIMTPPVDYQVKQHHILNLSFDQEIKILKMPFMKAVYNKDGDMVGEEVDTKLLAVQQKIAESMRNRIMGMPINRTMQVNQNFNGPIPGDGGVAAGVKPLEQMDESELHDYISELKGEKGIEGSSPRFKDVGERD